MVIESICRQADDPPNLNSLLEVKINIVLVETAMVSLMIFISKIDVFFKISGQCRIFAYVLFLNSSHFRGVITPVINTVVRKGQNSISSLRYGQTEGFTVRYFLCNTK